MTLQELVDRIASRESWDRQVLAGAYALTVPQGAGRSQRVTATEFSDGGTAHVRFTSRVGPAAALDAARSRSALELNARLPHGCLAVDGDSLVLTATRPLGTTTPETSAAVVRYLAQQADTYEKHIFGKDTE